MNKKILILYLNAIKSQDHKRQYRNLQKYDKQRNNDGLNRNKFEYDVCPDATQATRDIENTQLIDGNENNYYEHTTHYNLVVFTEQKPSTNKFQTILRKKTCMQNGQQNSSAAY